MIDAVKPAVSDEMVELFGINFWPINAASKIDAQREHIRNALSAALTAPAQPATDDIADAVLSWMVKHDLLDAGNEYHASDVLAVLDDLAPARPVGVPVGYVSTVELHTLRNIDTCVDLFSMPPEDGFQFVPVYAAPHPPAEGGWEPMESAPKDGTEILGFGSASWQGKKYAPARHVAWFAEGKWWGRDPDTHAGLHLIAWMPLPPAPANGGEQNG